MGKKRKRKRKNGLFNWKNISIGSLIGLGLAVTYVFLYGWSAFGKLLLSWGLGGLFLSLLGIIIIKLKRKKIRNFIRRKS